MLEMRLVLSLGLAGLLVFTATPLAIRLAARLDFYDCPVGYKGHGSPTPYLGGVPIVLAFVLGLVLWTGDWNRALPVIIGVIVLAALGILDDRRTVSPAVRVAVEIALAVGLWMAGDGWKLGSAPALDLVVTVIWVVAVVNALNLFDNLDGAASSMAVVISAGVAIMGAIAGDVWVACAAATLCGACLGFLPRNLSAPARIFLGDGGSMPIGFGLAALVMIGTRTTAPAWQALAVGLLLVGIPGLDTCLVIVSRRRRGVSILTAGRDHLTHRTLRRFRTARGVAVVLGSVQAVLAAVGLFAARRGSVLLVIVVLAYILAAIATIVVLDSDAKRAKTESVTAVSEGSVWGSFGRYFDQFVIGLLGLGVGLSPLVEGLYDQKLWIPAGLGLLIIGVTVAIARAPQLTRAGVGALAGISALGLFALLSMTWAGSMSEALINANRYLLYAAFLAACLLCMRSERCALIALAAFLAGAFVIGALDIGRMLAGDISGLFVGGRLHGPLGYINGQGCFFLLAAWVAVAAAESRRSLALAAGALTLSFWLICLTLMTQSRGALLAAIISVGVVLVFTPGRLRRVVTLGLLACGVAVVQPHLSGLAQLAGSDGFSNAVQSCARLMIVIGIAIGLSWCGVLILERSVVARSRTATRVARMAVIGLCAVAVVIFAGFSLNHSARIATAAKNQFSAFIHLNQPAAPATSNHLLSAGGNRYDYWRVAAHAFMAHPVAGVGGGNYSQSYFRLRTTTEDVQQPHSLGFQVLSELGLVGIALLCLIIACIGVGLYRHRQRRGSVSGGPHWERFLLVSATGVLVAWAVHASVDWMHLLPGLCGAALIAVAVLLRPTANSTIVRTSSLLKRTVVPIVCICVALIAASSLTWEFLSDQFRTQAQSALKDNPRAALDLANRSLRLNDSVAQTYYIKAAALARFDMGDAAARTMQEATVKDSGNFLSFALLGDIYVRQGRMLAAKRAYQTALRLNPLDQTLKQLANNPALARRAL